MFRRVTENLMKIDKVIDIIRHLNEEVPTNNASSGYIAGFPPDQPPIKNVRKKKKYAYGGKDSRKWWIQSLKDSN